MDQILRPTQFDQLVSLIKNLEHNLTAKFDEKFDQQTLAFDKKLNEQSLAFDKKLNEQSLAFDKKLNEQSLAFDSKLQVLEDKMDRKFDQQTQAFDRRFQVLEDKMDQQAAFNQEKFAFLAMRMDKLEENLESFKTEMRGDMKDLKERINVFEQKLNKVEEDVKHTHFTWNTKILGAVSIISIFFSILFHEIIFALKEI